MSKIESKGREYVFEYNFGTPSQVFGKEGIPVKREEIAKAFSSWAQGREVVGVYQEINLKGVPAEDREEVVVDDETQAGLDQVMTDLISGSEVARRDLIAVVYNPARIQKGTIDFAVKTNAPAGRILTVDYNHIPNFDGKLDRINTQFKRGAKEAVIIGISPGNVGSKLVTLGRYETILADCQSQYGLTRNEYLALQVLRKVAGLNEAMSAKGGFSLPVEIAEAFARSAGMD